MSRIHTRILTIALLLFAVAFLAPAPAHAASVPSAVSIVAQTGPTAPPIDLADLPAWLNGGGLVAIVLAFLLERWPWYATQSGATKFVFALAVAALSGALAYALQNLTPGQATLGQQIWDFINYLIKFIGTVTGAHLIDKALPARFHPAPKAVG